MYRIWSHVVVVVLVVVFQTSTSTLTSIIHTLHTYCAAVADLGYLSWIQCVDDEDEHEDEGRKCLTHHISYQYPHLSLFVMKVRGKVKVRIFFLNKIYDYAPESYYTHYRWRSKLLKHLLANADILLSNLKADTCIWVCYALGGTIVSAMYSINWGGILYASIDWDTSMTSVLSYCFE